VNVVAKLQSACLQCNSKNPRGFLTFSPKRLEILVQILRAYYSIISYQYSPTGRRFIALRALLFSALRASVRRIYRASRSNSLGPYGPLSGVLLAIALRALLSAVFIALRAWILSALAGLCKEMAFTRWRQIFIALRARILLALAGLCKEFY